ncbi:hypothetical protein PMZ80_002974 [Knufia obscura]|uniref:Uncharacterized protein n=1 Tax=Knufia obscura TaxID=1635080 RepID=A0ABR0RYT0_9EURO|nr:hypothetical protein PMZ80_002974 [Knufia obscura]
MFDYGARSRWDQLSSRSRRWDAKEETRPSSNPAVLTKSTSSSAKSPGAPPAYDQLSIAPPAVEESSVQRPDAQTVSDNRTAPEKGRGTMLKQKWKELKEDDKRRKADRFQTVSAMEADKILALAYIAKKRLRELLIRAGKGFKGLHGYHSPRSGHLT